MQNRVIMRQHIFIYSVLSIAFVLAFSVFYYLVLSEDSPEGEQKFLILAVDGADWEIIDQLIKQGRLPTMEKLLDLGVRAPLETIYPTLSPNIWTSVATGRTPDEHGITCWVTAPLVFAPEEKSPDADTASPSPLPQKNRAPMNFQRRIRAFWNIASEYGLPSVTIGWMMSDPVEIVNGSQVGFNINPSGLPDFYPEKIEPLLPKLLLKKKHQLVSSVFGNNIELKLKQSDQAAQRVFSVLERALYRDVFFLESAKNILPQENWKIAAVYCRIIDVTQHLFLQYYQGGQDGPQIKDTSFGDVIPDCYSFIDRQIAEILERIDPETNIIILSDHGIRPVQNHPFKLDITPVIDAINSDQKLATWTARITARQSKHVDDSRTFHLAFNTDYSEEQKQQARQEIFSILSQNLSISETNEGLFLENNGQYPLSDTITLRLNPTLKFSSTIRFGNLSWKIADLISPDPLAPFEFSGVHLARPDGIFLLLGPHARKMSRTERVRVYDIMPTIFAYLDIPLSNELRGTVREDLFRQPPPTIKHIDTYEKIPYKPKFAPSMQKKNGLASPEQLEELKLLGYIS